MYDRRPLLCASYASKVGRTNGNLRADYDWEMGLLCEEMDFFVSARFSVFFHVKIPRRLSARAVSLMFPVSRISRERVANIAPAVAAYIDQHYFGIAHVIYCVLYPRSRVAFGNANLEHSFPSLIRPASFYWPRFKNGFSVLR